ncbi:uncharacterized protein N7459_001250 [Penicillium hispanicum]|uniref:uncharacterized protein n=1 Tax=Penicillium hispanicum TaxID=1080232 RepID=UPI00253F7768|nr:uncharacterized protein N7459_001250 [Penicillium hispanicum]KAJ5595042.1 hypothetical protein N7459_001250 [Penicillium hispanicum]
MSHATTEFIFFKVKPAVQPEDPDSDEGRALMEVFHSTKHQSGHHNSAWGRAIEDQSVIVWVVDWTDARGSSTMAHLKPFLAEIPQGPTAVFTTLSPSIVDSDTLTSNPVTELCPLAFPGSLTIPERKQLDGNLINFRTALMEQLPQAEAPKSWAMGHVDRPSTVPHEKSPSGDAIMHLLTVGWESVEAHMKAKQTEQFVQSIAPIREKMLSPVPGLEMKHVSFKKI